MKPNTSYYLAITSAIWFLLTSWLWTYWLNVFISFPLAVLSGYLLHKPKVKNIGKYKTVIIILSLGVLSAAISLMFFIR